MEKRLFIIILLLLAKLLPAQTKQDSATDKKLDTILKKLEELENKMGDTTQQVGVLSYTENPVYLYEGNVENQLLWAGKMVNVDSIFIRTKDGYILDINVFCGGKRFSNGRAPITLTVKRIGKGDKLFNVNNDDECVHLNEILSYLPYNSYLADDGSYWLKPTQRRIILKRNVGLNTIFDIRLYTDALALFGEQSNGLALTDARFKQVFQNHNIPNSGVFLGHYVKINFNAAKFDSKYRYADSSDFSRTDLLQKSRFTGEAAVNVFDVWLEHKSLSSAYVDFGLGASSGLLATPRDTSSVFTTYLFFETGFNIRASDNIGADLNFRVIRQFSPSTDFVSDTIRGKTYDFSKPYTFFRFSGEVYWNPLGDAASRIFGRVNYYCAAKTFEKKNNFLQFQLGYSILLSKLLSKKD